MKLAAALILTLSLGGLSLADTVTLKGSQSITGTIVSDKPGALYVDIGVDVLRIPKEDVQEVKYSSAQNGVPEANAITPEPAQSSGQLYHTGNLEKTTIEKCVDRFSHAVVKVSSPDGLGSGFFINENGYLITNCHVIEKETRIEVTVFEKAKAGFEKKVYKKVRIEALNPFVDLALLKVEDLGDTKTTFVYLGNSEKITVGEKVFAIGTPLGLERTVTDGVVSTRNRAFEGLVYLQTNAAINPGNSGGPLFNLAGEVVGVTNMGYIFFGGLGFAIPVDNVKRFIENREAFAYDKDNPNTGFRYVQPQGRVNKEKPKLIKARTDKKSS